MLLSQYTQLVEPTDKMPVELQPVLFGLYGEVGSVMAASKKYHREKENYVRFRYDTVEEFGDVLWYLAAIARRLGVGIDEVFLQVGEASNCETAVATSSLSDWPLVLAKRTAPPPELDHALLRLGEAAAALLTLNERERNAKAHLSAFVERYLTALHASGITFDEVVHFNTSKTRGRFLEPAPSSLRTFDSSLEEEEQLPWHFEVRITQRKSGKSYLQWKGVFLGDPLTDNIADKDGYRFHDVFHLAHAAVLHWSPVFRALIKHKRKSVPEIDEAQDGGRAIVIEEGLTAWIFSQAKQVGFFAGRDSISFDLLKVVQRFVTGYEVEQCPLKLWESAILQGYEAFLQVRQNNGGVLIGDRKARTLRFASLAQSGSET